MEKTPSVIDYQTQLTAPFSEGSASQTLYSAWIEGPLGLILAISDEHELYLLEFLQRRHLTQEIQNLRLKAQSPIHPGSTAPLRSIERELGEYFKGKRREFETPFRMGGTPFQRKVWQALLDIPYGETCSYLELARAVGNPKAFRAVAQANGKNQLGIIIPCHRVIQSNGGLGGYGGGLQNKKRLLELEGSWNA